LNSVSSGILDELSQQTLNGRLEFPDRLNSRLPPRQHKIPQWPLAAAWL